MNYKIKNKYALITGASKGIGEEICKSLSKEGAIIIACSRSKKNLLKLTSSLPNKKKHIASFLSSIIIEFNRSIVLEKDNSLKKLYASFFFKINWFLSNVDI